ncbi:ArsR/SmtB family transcription factor [Glaesserella sp.]|uniref:ArsR/SmtB family transcription factor n=1 Tax=Glaesserella sp. TaxID=2094731 RepID=UPI0035A0844F
MDEKFEKYNEATTFLKLLANPNRLAILCHLQHKAFNVTELTLALGMPQAALSNQLAILRESGLIDCDIKHRERIYYIKDAKVIETIQLLHRFFCDEKAKSSKAA